MTKFDDINADEGAGTNAALRKVLISTICGITIVFGLGVFAGFANAAFGHGTPSPLDFAILAGIALAIAGCVFTAWKLWPAPSTEPIATSTRKSKNILYLAMGAGLALGVYFGLTEGTSGANLFSDNPVSATTAAIGILFWVVVIPPLTWVWWRTVDEHEASAYTDGALIAAHAYLILAPVWWLASRAGWVPEQNPMIMFVGIASLWSIIWLYRRYF